MSARTDFAGNHLTITIVPSLSDDFLNSQKLKDLVRQDRFHEFFFGVMEDLRLLEERLTKHLSMVSSILQGREWREDALNHIGELILDYALHNAMNGYEGTSSISRHGTRWEPRSELTKELYQMISENHFGSDHDPEHPGLTAGEDKLFDSLITGDEDNIFEVRPDAGRVVVGSKFRHASLLEHGGYRSGDPETNLGVTRDAKTGMLKPTQWLIRSYGGNVDEATDKMWEIINADKYVPPRPYLKPALWSVKDEEWSLTVLAQVFGGMLIREMNELSPAWSSASDVVNIEIHASRVVAGPET